MNCVSLYTGCGGLDLGFHDAGFTTVWANDIDPFALQTYSSELKRRGAKVPVIYCGDVSKAELPSRGSAEVVIGGPPCQGFSQVRNHSRLIDDPKNSLYREFVRVIAESSPHAFLMENVTGMDQMGVREQILEDLTLGGLYRVRSQVVDAADFNVPQSRKRLLFLGLRSTLNLEPPLLHGTGVTAAMALARRNGKSPARYEIEATDTLWASSLNSILEDPANMRIVTVAQAISDLRDLPIGGRDDTISYDRLPPPESAYQAWMRETNNDQVANVRVPRINPDTALRLQSIPQGGNHRDLPPSLLKRYLSDKRWGQDNGTGLLSRRHFYAYRKLHPGVWAWTLNTKADSAYHYSMNRALSVREFARIQSFPDRFVIATDPRKGPLAGRIDGGGAHSRYRQVGNAVPPLLARAVATAFKELLLPDSATTRQSEKPSNETPF